MTKRVQRVLKKETPDTLWGNRTSWKAEPPGGAAWARPKKQVVDRWEEGRDRGDQMIPEALNQLKTRLLAKHVSTIAKDTDAVQSENERTNCKIS